MEKTVIKRVEETLLGRQVLNLLKILTPYRLKKMSVVDQKSYWSKIAKNFDEKEIKTSPKGYIRFYDEVILENIRALTDVKSILDVGSSSGRRLSLLRKSFPDKSLVGCDFVAKQLEISKQLFFKDDDGVSLVCCNATSLPFGDNSFDLVFTSTVLMFVPPSDINRTIAGFRRVSKKYVLLVEPYLKHLPLTNRIEYLGLNYVYMHDYEKILEKYGFQKIKVFGILDKNNRCRYTLFLFCKGQEPLEAIK